jgi:hypothetical protein
MISDCGMRIAELQMWDVRCEMWCSGFFLVPCTLRLYAYWLLTTKLSRYAPCAMHFAVYNQ